MAKFDPVLSLDCAGVEGVGAQFKERKGSNFAPRRNGAIVQKPEGQNTRVLSIIGCVIIARSIRRQAQTTFPTIISEPKVD